MNVKCRDIRSLEQEAKDLVSKHMKLHEIYNSVMA